MVFQKGTTLFAKGRVDIGNISLRLKAALDLYQQSLKAGLEKIKLNPNNKTGQK